MVKKYILLHCITLHVIVHTPYVRVGVLEAVLIQVIGITPDIIHGDHHI